MSAEISVEKQVTAVRHVVRRGDETLWWGQVTARPNKKPSQGNHVLSPFFVFATTMAQAQSRILGSAKRQYGANYTDYRIYDAIPGRHEPYEVELSAMSTV